MKLIGSLTSPFVRKVRVVLSEKKIEYEFGLDSPWSGDTQVPDFNPLGKVPVLLLDDDTALFDSRVICEYLDNVAPNNKLMPATNRERTEVKRWEALADGVCEAAGNIFLERKRPAEQQSADWIVRQESKIIRGLDYMSDELGENAWCMGTHFTLADIASGCALGYLAFRSPEIDWNVKHPNLSRFYDKIMQRAAFVETIPQG
ncbi:glutathione S-transferase [Propionivibrio limicola]|uniref:glutathione S-transferase n=1 Tax=Propionivibrio limicola TaxID=167645 RepID=UPI001291441D|nr:glutathione S-transferase [Propionivibrio limicola]